MKNSEIGYTTHGHHPGWEAEDCEHRIVVTRCVMNGSNGFACELSGGHCLPESSKCPIYAKTATDIQNNTSKILTEDFIKSSVSIFVKVRL